MKIWQYWSLKGLFIMVLFKSRRVSNCNIIAAALAQIVLKSRTVLLLCTPIFKCGGNCLNKLVSMRCGHEHFDAWPHLILICLYKQLALHFKIGVHKSNTVCDFDTISAEQQLL